MTTAINALGSADKQAIIDIVLPKVRHVPVQAANAQVALAAAIASIGTGIILLDDGDYVFSASLTIPSGITLIGVKPTLRNVSNGGDYSIFDALRTYLSGTRLLGDGTGTYDCLVGNNIDAGSPAAHYADNTLSNVNIHNLYIEGFRYPMKFGARNVMGLHTGSVRGVIYKNNKYPASLINFVHCEFDDIYVQDDIAGLQGGIDFVADVSSALLVHGNTSITNIYSQTTRRTNTNVRFIATAGSQLNEMRVANVEAFKFGEFAASATATFTNGSANITVPLVDSVNFPVGSCLVLSTAGIGNFIGGAAALKTYVVAYNDGASPSVIRLNTTYIPGTTGIVFSGTNGTAAIKSAGWPCLSVIGYDAGSILNSTFDAMDIEGTNNAAGTGSAVFVQNTANATMQLAGTSGAFDNFLVARGADINFYANSSLVTTDFDLQAVGYYGTDRGAIHGAAGNGHWKGMQHANSQNLSVSLGSLTLLGAGATGPVIDYGGTNIVPSQTRGLVRFWTGAAPGNITMMAPEQVSTDTILFTLNQNNYTASGWDHICVSFTPVNAAAARLLPHIRGNYLPVEQHVNMEVAPNTQIIATAAGNGTAVTCTTKDPHLLVTGDVVIFIGSVGMTDLNSPNYGAHVAFAVTVTNPTTFTVPSASVQTYTANTARFYSQTPLCLEPNTRYDFTYIIQ